MAVSRTARSRYRAPTSDRWIVCHAGVHKKRAILLVLRWRMARWRRGPEAERGTGPPRRPAAALPTLPGSFRGTPHHQTEEQGPEFRTRPLVGSTVKAKNSELHRRSPNRMTCRPTWTCVLAQRARLKYLPWARLWCHEGPSKC